MRFRDYPAAGHPPALTAALEELLVLTYGAIESTNVERWALEFGAAEAPGLPGTMRRSAYETDVVGSIHRLGQRYWERRGEAAVWERPFPTGQQGRPPAVDIALFNSASTRETRLEFGLCSTTAAGTLTRQKLRDDADKLAELSAQTEPGFGTIENYVVLWHHYRVALTGERRRTFRRTMQDHAELVAATDGSPEVELLVTSGGDLFAPQHGHEHWVAIGLFRVSTP